MMCHLSLNGNFLTGLNGHDFRELFKGQAQKMPNNQIFFSLEFTFSLYKHYKGNCSLVLAFIPIADIIG